MGRLYQLYSVSFQALTSVFLKDLLVIVLCDDCFDTQGVLAIGIVSTP